MKDKASFEKEVVYNTVYMIERFYMILESERKNIYLNDIKTQSFDMPFSLYIYMNHI